MPAPNVPKFGERHDTCPCPDKLQLTTYDVLYVIPSLISSQCSRNCYTMSIFDHTEYCPVRYRTGSSMLVYTTADSCGYRRNRMVSSMTHANEARGLSKCQHRKACVYCCDGDHPESQGLRSWAIL
ncbi:uncharacterized protein FFM5_15005 [Fusarium fujikuroi]|nr:uncharacterized protein FFM5_15005 [Fusarium fujikuroi]